MHTDKANLNYLCLLLSSTYAVFAEEGILRVSVGNSLETSFPVPRKKYQELLEKEDRMEQKMLWHLCVISGVATSREQKEVLVSQVWKKVKVEKKIIKHRERFLFKTWLPTLGLTQFEKQKWQCLGDSGKRIELYKMVACGEKVGSSHSLFQVSGHTGKIMDSGFKTTKKVVFFSDAAELKYGAHCFQKCGS